MFGSEKLSSGYGMYAGTVAVMMMYLLAATILLHTFTRSPSSLQARNPAAAKVIGRG
jgi:hypothetical protein